MLPGPFRNRNRVPSPFTGGSLFDKLFQDLQGNFLGSGLGRFGNTDIYEKVGSLHYELELPGMEKGDITFQTRRNKLVVAGEVSKSEEE